LEKLDCFGLVLETVPTPDELEGQFCSLALVGLTELKTQQIIDALGKEFFVVFRRKTVRSRQIKFWL
jgi:hypothetical protein